MFKKVFIVIVFSFPLFSNGISTDNIAEYIGENIKVCGKVYSIYYAKNSKGKPTFLNIDGYYPNQKLTLVVWEKYKDRFGNLKKLENKTICVKGFIEVYKGIFEIILKDKNQLEIKLN